MIRLRHLVPSVAFKVSKLPVHGYQFSYVVPDTLDDAFAWANEVVHFYMSGTTFAENHERFARERCWGAKDDQYTIELHVAPHSAGRTGSSSSWTLHE